MVTEKEVRVERGYWVAFADVSDPEGYKAYIAENAKAFRKYGGRFLTRGGKSECYRSPEYAKAMALRQGKSVMDLAIVEGYDGLQPTDM